jgi:hypothetical protein
MVDPGVGDLDSFPSSFVVISGAALGCAWCIGGRKCVEDKPWICAGDTDHIGTIGKVKQVRTQ